MILQFGANRTVLPGNGRLLRQHNSPGFKSDILRGNSPSLRTATSRIIAYHTRFAAGLKGHKTPLVARVLMYSNTRLYKMQVLFLIFLTFFERRQILVFQGFGILNASACFRGAERPYIKCIKYIIYSGRL